MKHRRGKATALLVGVACVVSAACGARVTDEQVDASRAVRLGPAGSGQDGATATVGVADVGGPVVTVNAGETSNSDASTATAVGRAGPFTLTASDTGITSTDLTLGSVTELSGPVPGLFQGSVFGVNALAAYLNSVGGLAGRRVKVDVRDDQFDSAQNRNVSRELIAKSFAMIGGVSLYDDASAEDVRKSGIPDIPGITLNKVRADLPNNFAPTPNVDGAATGQFLWFQRKFPDAVKAVGSVYGDVPSAKRSHENFRMAAESIGYEWKYDRGYQPTESDFTADIIRMRQSGVRAVFLIALDGKNVARVLKAASQQSWKPDVWIVGGSAYDRVVPALAGSAADGIHIFSTLALYAGEDSANVPEVRLFNQWFQKVRPGGTPDAYAAYAWISGRLLQQAMEKTGPNPKRSDVNAALRTITKFSANGMQAETSPGTKGPSSCYLIMRLDGGKYHRVDPADNGFICEGTVLRR